MNIIKQNSNGNDIKKSKSNTDQQEDNHEMDDAEQ